MNRRKTGFIHPIASPDGLWKAEEELNNIWTEEYEIVLTAINVHCDANERVQKATNTSFDSNGFRKEKKKKKNKTNKQTERRGGRKLEEMSIIVIPDMIVDRVGYWYKGNNKKQMNKKWRFGWHVTGNSADNSCNYHEEFACSCRRCHLLNSLLIVFCRVSGANEREARAVHITVKLPPPIISNSKKTSAFRQRE